MGGTQAVVGSACVLTLKCVMPTYSSPSATETTGDAPRSCKYKQSVRNLPGNQPVLGIACVLTFMNDAGCVAATNCGRSCPNARTVSAPGSPVSIKTMYAQPGSASFSIGRSGKVVICAVR